MNTSGTPVSGKTPIIEAMLRKDCAVSSMMIPETSSLPIGRAYDWRYVILEEQGRHRE